MQVLSYEYTLNEKRESPSVIHSGKRKFWAKAAKAEKLHPCPMFPLSSSNVEMEMDSEDSSASEEEEISSQYTLTSSLRSSDPLDRLYQESARLEHLSQLQHPQDHHSQKILQKNQMYSSNIFQSTNNHSSDSDNSDNSDDSANHSSSEDDSDNSQTQSSSSSSNPSPDPTIHEKSNFPRPILSHNQTLQLVPQDSIGWNHAQYSSSQQSVMYPQKYSTNVLSQSDSSFSSKVDSRGREVLTLDSSSSSSEDDQEPVEHIPMSDSQKTINSLDNTENNHPKDIDEYQPSRNYSVQDNQEQPSSPPPVEIVLDLKNVPISKATSVLETQLRQIVLKYSLLMTKFKVKDVQLRKAQNSLLNIGKQQISKNHNLERQRNFLASEESRLNSQVARLKLENQNLIKENSHIKNENTQYVEKIQQLQSSTQNIGSNACVSCSSKDLLIDSLRKEVDSLTTSNQILQKAIISQQVNSSKSLQLQKSSTTPEVLKQNMVNSVINTQLFREVLSLRQTAQKYKKLIDKFAKLTQFDKNQRKKVVQLSQHILVLENQCNESNKRIEKLESSFPFTKKWEAFRNQWATQYGSSGYPDPEKIVFHIQKSMVQISNLKATCLKFKQHLVKLKANNDSLLSWKSSEQSVRANIEKQATHLYYQLKKAQRSNTLLTQRCNDAEKLFDSCSLLPKNAPKIKQLQIYYSKQVSLRDSLIQSLESQLSESLGVTENSSSIRQKRNAPDQIDHHSPPTKKNRESADDLQQHSPLDPDTIILHLKANPLAISTENHKDLLIQTLKSQLEKQSDNVLPFNAVETISSLETKVGQHRERYQKARTLFTQQIALFREACYSLTGYDVQMKKNSMFRVQSMYSSNENDYLLFQKQHNQQKEIIEFRLIPNEYSSSLDPDILLMAENSIPAFLSDLLIKEYSKTTIMV